MMQRVIESMKPVVLVAGVVITAAVLFPVFARARENTRRSSCQSNLKMVGLGYLQYVMDYDDKLPPARTGGGYNTGGWADALEAYMPTRAGLVCPSTSTSPSEDKPGVALRTDYFMNSRLAGVLQRDVTDAALTVIGGDSTPGMSSLSPHYAIPALPTAWSTNASSPRNRHFEGSNFAFVDGHIKWYIADNKIGTSNPRAGLPTFAVK